MAELSVSDSVTVSDLNSQEQLVLNSAAAAGNETTAVPPPQTTNELEQKKKRLLEELESALVSTPIPKPVHKPNPKPNRLGLGIEVIDETALLDSIPKIGKQSRRRASKKIHKKAVTVTETESESSIHLVARNISSSSSSSENERKYSREEMEAVRFVNVSQQRKFWKKIYDALQSTFSGEYDALVAAPNNPPPFVPNKKPILIGAISEECIEDDDSEDDYASIQRPAFQVDGEPNFDSGPPEDGWEYLRRVRWEAQQFPNVKISKLDRSKLTKEQSPYMPQIPDIAKCPEHLLPLKQWEDAFLAEFSALRVNLSCLVEERSSTMLSGSNFGDILLCNNKSIAKADQPTNLAGKHEDNITSLENPGLKTSKDQTCSNIPTPPLLSTILGMDSVARVSMLLKRIRLLEPENTITRIDCLWLFALCAAVDTPLDADTCAALRSLLRKCADIRAGKAELDDEVVMLNILATISGRYFGQSEN